MPSISMRQLLEAGVHFGHQTRRWNPKMRPFIFAERNGIHIIDLAQTAKRLETALEFVRETVARGEVVLFVGTKKQAQEPLRPRRPRRHALRQQALARRHASRTSSRSRSGSGSWTSSRRDRGRRSRSLPEEGGREAHRGAQAPPGDARRHPQDEAPARRDLHRRPASGADRGDRRPTASRSRSSARATPTSIPTSSTSSSRRTTTPSARSGSCARSSPTRPSRAPRSARAAPSSPRSRCPRSRRTKTSRRPTSSSPPRRWRRAELRAG